MIVVLNMIIKSCGMKVVTISHKEAKVLNKNTVETGLHDFLGHAKVKLNKHSIQYNHKILLSKLRHSYVQLLCFFYNSYFFLI